MISERFLVNSVCMSAIEFARVGESFLPVPRCTVYLSTRGLASRLVNEITR